MNMYDIITKKKHGETLTEDEIRFAVNGFTDGSIPDYQMSALLMAICLKGMNDAETAALTFAMRDSGSIDDIFYFIFRLTFPFRYDIIGTQPLPNTIYGTRNA